MVGPTDAPPSGRRRRNPQATREEILAAARTVLASDGPDGLSLSRVAHLAGVNRGTAYQHFETRDDLIQATVDWVSEHLLQRIFGDNDEGDGQPHNRPIFEAISILVDFAVENPELGRIWLFSVMSSDNPGENAFFRRFAQSTRDLAESEHSEEGIDAEALSVVMLAGYFLWPLWVRANSRTTREREAMTRRMRREMLRLMMHGVVRAESFPHLQQLLDDSAPQKSR
ncbi:TetR/AcrR family transcriptional regulator [Mangrovimicrobium sediminis]|uniref:TetR/AcrR family transcriptional regulator n=1 Tax=Mangrovimicrobium sediminis TaxID=2562682 RepID=A0A4Z0LVS9_9GAMM|nr:TetR/AcrR family transcriptional regulator [Haliea sp. SAOS-164]TGD71379.1 TetR/AcrR family transcriptional regulator [Haliea sp. SAOS-164]